MAELHSELTTDFSRGMDDSSAATAHPPNAAQQIINGRIEADGTVRRRWGSRRRNSSALNTGTGFGAIEFTTAAGDEQEIAIIGTKAYMSDDNWATSTEVATGLREDYYDFATMRVGSSNYLFMANGDTTIKRWDGSTWDTLPNAPSGVKFIEVFNSRLYATGHSGVLVQASKVADPETWASPDGLTVQVSTHDGDSPTALFQIGSHLLVFDRHATSYIDGYGEQTLIVASGATGFSRSVGCIAFRTIRAVGDSAVCWLSERGVEYYSTGGGIRLLSRYVQRFMDTINRAQIESTPGQPTAVYDDRTQDYVLALSTTGTRNNRNLVINLLKEGRGWKGSPTIDRALVVDGDILFAAGNDGYLTTTSGTYEVKSDADGYMTLTDASDGDPVEEDSGGYLSTVTDDTLPATLYLGHHEERGHAIHSLGYDGFIRQHHGFDQDDQRPDGSGGVDVTLTVVTRPFLMRTARHRKRVRAAHIASINNDPVTISTAIRTRGATSAFRDKAIPATAFNQPRRKKVMFYETGDYPQVEIQTTDRARISLVGLSAELLREPL